MAPCCTFLSYIFSASPRGALLESNKMDFEFIKRSGLFESHIDMLQAGYFSAVGGQAPAFWFELGSNLLLAVLMVLLIPKLFPQQVEGSGVLSRLVKCFFAVTFAPLLVYWLPSAFYISDTFGTPFFYGLVSFAGSFCQLLMTPSFWHVSAQLIAVFLFLMLLVLLIQAHRRPKEVLFNCHDYSLCVAWGAVSVGLLVLAAGIIFLLAALIYSIAIGLLSYLPIILLALVFLGKCLGLNILGCLVFSTPVHFAISIMAFFTLALTLWGGKLVKKLRYG